MPHTKELLRALTPLVRKSFKRRYRGPWMEHHREMERERVLTSYHEDNGAPAWLATIKRP